MKLPQLDVIVVHSRKDKRDAQGFLKNLCSKHVNVRGQLFADFLTEDDEGVMHISSYRQGAIAKNIQRATYIILYVTELFYTDAEVKSTFLHALQNGLIDNTKDKHIIPVWVQPQAELKQSTNECLDDCSDVDLFLSGLNGLSMHKEELSKLDGLLKSQSTQHKKLERQEEQDRIVEKWKAEARHKRIMQELQRKTKEVMSFIKQLEQFRRAQVENEAAVGHLRILHASVWNQEKVY